MSLLSAVIQEADKTNTEDIMKACNELLPKIIDLTERVQVFSWGLQNHFIDVYLTSDSSRSLEQMNYKNRKYRVNTDLEELKQEIQAFQKEFSGKNVDINNACKKLDAVVASFKDSCIMVDGTYILQTAARNLKSLNYVDAIVKLKNLHNRLDKLEFEGNLALALCSFRSISDTQLAVSQGQLSVEFSNLFSWSYNKSIPIVTYSLSVQQSDPILLERVLKALYISDQMIIDIQPFSHFFVLTLVPNIIKHNCEIFTEDHLGALVFNIKIDLNDTSCPSIPTIFNNLTAVFEFLETTMGAKLEADKTFFECFGDSNRNEFFNKLIQDCIKNNLPYCETSHQAYKEIALELDTFNKLLVDLKYVEAEDSPLKKYIHHTELLLYDTKCKKMLAEVRKLMKEYLSQETVIVGTLPDSPDASVTDITSKGFKYDLNTPPFFPKCVISQNMRRIALIIITNLEESATLPVEYANQLVLYIKDIAVMYQGMVVQRNGVRLKTHALEIAIFFNNCHYLAHTLFGPPWKNVLPKTTADHLNITLMSYIYDLRIIGMEKLSLYLKKNREEICTKMEGIFKHWRLEAFEEFNRDVNHVLGFLTEIKDTWSDILPVRMYERAMCSLVDTISEAMVKRALRHVEDITEDVICLLASRFQYTIDEIQDLYPDISKLDSIQVKHWEKFTLIPQLFTAQLLEISKMWNETDNLKGKMSCDEVRLIIKMRFPNDEYRLKILKGIQ